MLHISAPEKKYLLGIDLRGGTCQISYMTNRRQRPWRNTEEEENIYGEPVTFAPGDRSGTIPICLCRSSENDRWYFGEEAQKMSARGKGPLIRGFLDEASFGRTVRFGTEHYNPASLLTVFFRGVLQRLSAAVPLAQIDTMVFTSRGMNADLEEVLRRVTRHLPVEVNHVFCEDYARSFYSYLVMQPQKIRGNESAVLDLSDDGGFYLNRVRFYTDRSPALCLPEEERVSYSAVREQDEEESGHLRVARGQDEEESGHLRAARGQGEEESGHLRAARGQDGGKVGHRTAPVQDGEERILFSTAQGQDGNRRIGPGATQKQDGDRNTQKAVSSAEAPKGSSGRGNGSPDPLQNGDPRDETVYRYLVQTLRPDELASVYITGPGASEKWLKKSLDFLSHGRHAFLGNNLFSRGAACSALLRTVQPEQAKDHLYIDRNALPVSIGMNILEENGASEEERYHEFLKAGTPWKNARADLEVILESGRELRFVIAPATGESPHEELLKLEGLPKRPERTSTLQIHLSMLSPAELEIHVKDLGFGDIFPAAGRTWESVISL